MIAHGSEVIAGNLCSSQYVARKQIIHSRIVRKGARFPSLAASARFMQLPKFLVRNLDITYITPKYFRERCTLIPRDCDRDMARVHPKKKDIILCASSPLYVCILPYIGKI